MKKIIKEVALAYLNVIIKQAHKIDEGDESLNLSEELIKF